ncbi:hypothetical protein CKO25_10440 [Thiocapsa imhoffii]|uniref:Non-specific protein-tyrosine kinase n=1 Tax=Thiocapsa imhoffii TaxID=382777 RepID=A0A9X1B993_9GAMM|nr:tyrosine-protein kinase [Thiocapsa imhoffii]MBK1645063.1 hypothetical protein [Thiocapsa imhoffii]
MKDSSQTANPRGPSPSGEPIVAGISPGPLDPSRGLLFSNPEGEFEGLDLKRYLAILFHRKWLLILAVLLSLVVGVFQTIREPPMYRAVARVQAIPPSDSLLGYRDFSALASSRNFAGDQLQLLRSTALAERAARTLNLELTPKPSLAAGQPSFFDEMRQALSHWWLRLRGLSVEPEQEDQADRHFDDPVASNQAAIAARIRGSLVVTPVRDSNLIELSMEGSDPRIIAALLNAVARTYVNFQTELRTEDATSTRRFYEEQIERTRIQLEDAERQLTAYARSRDLIHVDDLLKHMQSEYSALRDRLGAAERGVFQAEAKLRAMREIDAQGSSEFLGSPVIQSLKTRRGELEDEYQRRLEIFLPEYPAMIQLRRQIEAIDQQMAGELDSISRSLQIDYEANLKEQQLLADRVEEARLELLKVRDETIDYNALARARDTIQAMYNGLLSRVTEAELVSGIVQDNIRIVDLASVPSRPFKPDLQANLQKAVMIGLILGLLLIVLLEYLDDTFKSSAEVEKETGCPVLGSLPFITAKARDPSPPNLALSVATNPTGPMAEASRSLRTSLLFSTAEGAPKILHTTGATAGEGKSTACISIASSFAQSGNTVLCIDADLRNPSLHAIFDVPNDVGLSNYLTSSVPPAEMTQPTSIDGLYLISSGPLPPNPVELLSSTKMMHLLKLAAERFDHVLIDGPPVVGLADALVLSQLAGATVFVIDPAQVNRVVVRESLKRLRGSQAHLIGVVLQKIGRAGRRGYGYGYGYGYKYNNQYLYGYGQERHERSQA